MATAFRPGGRWRERGEAVAADPDAFDAHFRDNVQPGIDRLERLRLTLKDQYTWRLAVAAAGTVCVFLLTVIAHTLLRHADGGAMVDPQAMVAAPLMAALVLFAWAQGPRRRFVRTYKETLLPAIAEFFGRFTYDMRGGVEIGRIEESTLVPSHDRYRHEDLFAGDYRGVGVEFCEARLTEKRGSGRNRRTVTVFSGVFVLLTMNKNFRGRTVVRRDAGKLGNWLRDAFSGELEPVKLEDPVFEKMFEVYSDDQVEARYLLTPAFMVRLMELCQALNCDRLEAAFFGARLFIMLPTPPPARGGVVEIGEMRFHMGGAAGLFEPSSIYRSVHDDAEIGRIIAEFRSILSIVDTLKLHERTGL